MNDLTLLLRDDRRSFRPGETLEGVAGWRVEAPPASVEVRLFYYTRGKGTQDVGVAARRCFESPQAAEGRAFQFELPVEPYSFSGQLISLIWALELVVEPGPRSTRTEIVLSPSGQEILLN